MKPFEPNIQSLSLARDVLLTPFGLDESKLIKVLGTMFTHKVDYADLYFQFTKSEGWSLEEGIVKTGSFSIDQGVGVRASRATRPRLRIPMTSPKRRCWTRRPPPAPSPAQGAGQVKVAASVTAVRRAFAVPAARSAGLARRDREGQAAGARRDAWRAPRIRAWCRSWPAWPANTTWCWWCAATACWPPTSGRWCACR